MAGMRVSAAVAVSRRRHNAASNRSRGTPTGARPALECGPGVVHRGSSGDQLIESIMPTQWIERQVERHPGQQAAAKDRKRVERAREQVEGGGYVAEQGEGATHVVAHEVVVRADDRCAPRPLLTAQVLAELDQQRAAEGPGIGVLRMAFHLVARVTQRARRRRAEFSFKSERAVFLGEQTHTAVVMRPDFGGTLEKRHGRLTLA